MRQQKKKCRYDFFSSSHLLDLSLHATICLSVQTCHRLLHRLLKPYECVVVRLQPHLRGGSWGVYIIQNSSSSSSIITVDGSTFLRGGCGRRRRWKRRRMWMGRGWVSCVIRACEKETEGCHRSAVLRCWCTSVSDGNFHTPLQIMVLIRGGGGLSVGVRHL